MPSNARRGACAVWSVYAVFCVVVQVVLGHHWAAAQYAFIAGLCVVGVVVP